jgi:hypothetical protein
MCWHWDFSSRTSHQDMYLNLSKTASSNSSEMHPRTPSNTTLIYAIQIKSNHIESYSFPHDHPPRKRRDFSSWTRGSLSRSDGPLYLIRSILRLCASRLTLSLEFSNFPASQQPHTQCCAHVHRGRKCLSIEIYVSSLAFQGQCNCFRKGRGDD